MAESLLTFSANSVIFREGDAPDCAYMVVSGDVQISTDRGGNPVILTTIKPSQFFGEMALLENTPRSANATTIGGCQLRPVGREALMAKIDGLDPFTRYWIMHLTDRVKSLSKRARNPWDI